MFGNGKVNMFEKRLAAVPPQSFTVDGSTNGMIKIAADPATLFKVKQTVILTATGQSDIELEVKNIVNGYISVGPFASAVKAASPNSPSRPSVPASLLLRTDISAYTVAAGATIYADEQKRASIDWAEIVRAVYDEEPTVALRTIMVDQDGNKYSIDNPFPVSATVTPIAGTIPVKWTEIDLVYDSNNNLETVTWFDGATIEQEIHLTTDSNGNLTKVTADD